MKFPVPIGVIIALSSLRVAFTYPREPSSTSRSTPAIGETIRLLTNQLMETNASSSDVVFDTRTPPKIKQQVVKKKEEKNENSHAGIAIPVIEDDILEESTKKLNFYKVEKPTTNGGLSTWILLSGQTSPPATVKPKPSIKFTNNSNDRNTTVSTTPKKKTTTKPTTAKPTITQKTTTKDTKLTKIKASILSEAQKKSQNESTTLKPTTKVMVTTTKVIKAVTKAKDSDVKNVTISENVSNSVDLPVEAKDGGIELSTNSTETKKTRRTSTKRKKNKNRRRKPSASEKVDNATKIANKVSSSSSNKEKPISTQIYNYLSREVMPTVGVGLVGLMVTAGLASYFLYPFGVARRSYDIDRKDKDATYYYNDYYNSGGIAEEELIGKVIAGMPNYNQKSYRPSNIRTTYPTLKHRQLNNRHEHTTTYGYDFMTDIQMTDDAGDKNKVTPVTVPEHGPRNLNVRRKRQLESENEIDSDLTTSASVTTTNSPPSTSVATTKKPCIIHQQHHHHNTTNIADAIASLFHLKVNLGLQVLQNVTRTISRYLSEVQTRLNHDHYNHNGINNNKRPS